jgi:hypothetical protein
MLRGLVIAGSLDLNVDPGDGTFTGVLTPGVDADTLQPLAAVLFNATPEGLVPREIQGGRSVGRSDLNPMMPETGASRRGSSSRSAVAPRLPA